MTEPITDRNALALDILARLGAQPATSFREDGVANVVRTILAELEVPYQVDDYGNIIAHRPGKPSAPAGAAPADRSDVPPIAFVAHLDHPGFEAIAVDGDFLVGTAMGGVPPSSFESGVRLQALLPDGQRWGAVTAGPYGEGAERKTLISLDDPARLSELSLPASVVFDLVDFELDAEFIRMRAVDDLAGCGSILAMLAALADDTPDGDVYGVFTRAVEVGLVGARLLAEAGTLPPDTLVVSLESSRTLPGAEIGGGPVIRVGDAGFTFNADAESALIRARETLQSRPEGFKVQRQLMSGGTCEASAFALYGYRTTGIAFPLGNYHNGAPEGRIEAEYIHQEDFLGGVELMLEAVRRLPEREDTAFRRRLREVPEEFRRRMQG
jgi:putative aminopeptidase FrvX